MGSQNPNLGPKKHISMIAVTVFIADYFFVAAILEICKLANEICKISNGIWQIWNLREKTQ